MSGSSREGRCLCGAVQVTLARDVDEIGVCHCVTCRNWGSGPWLALQAPGSEITGDALVVFRSSSFAERGFCGACGTHVFHRPLGGPELAISVGLFDEGQRRVAREIFADRKPGYYGFVTAGAQVSARRMAFEWAPKLLWRGVKRLFGSG